MRDKLGVNQGIEREASQNYLHEKNVKLEESISTLSNLVLQITNYSGYLSMEIIPLNLPYVAKPMKEPSTKSQVDSTTIVSMIL